MYQQALFSNDNAVQELSAMTTLVAASQDSLSDAALMASLFGLSVQDASHVLSSKGNLIAAVDSLSQGGALIELAKRYFTRQIDKGDVLSDPDAVRLFLSSQLRDKPAECFCVMFLDTKHRLIAFEEMFQGTIDSASVHPREVVKRALHHNAGAVIFAHNHPSGVAEPSQADERITQKLCNALDLVDVRVLDHFVVGDTVVSFAERGLI